MNNDNELSDQQEDSIETESNAEVDRDHGNMNNGTIGGNMGVISSASGEDNQPDNNKNSIATTSTNSESALEQKESDAE